MSAATRFVEQRIQKNRAAEAKNTGIRRHLVEHSILAGHGQSALRVEAMKRNREHMEELKEMWADCTHMQREQEQEKRSFLAGAEERLAKELASRVADREREEQRRKMICESSDELRALKGRLHAADVSKQRAMQLLEYQTRQEREKMREERLAEHTEHERREYQELERKLEVEKAQQRVGVKHANHDQIAQREKLREEALLEHDREKAQVGAVVEKIAQEDLAEETARRVKQRDTRDMIEQNKAERAARQAEAAQKAKEELDRIEAFAQRKRDAEDQLEAEKEAKRQEQEKLQKGLCGEQEAKRRELDALDQLRNDLHREELEVAHRRREENAAQKRVSDRKAMMGAFSHQMVLKREKAEMDKVEEDKFRAKLMAKFAEDERIEQLNAQARRSRLEAHKGEAERLVEQRRRMYEAERREEVQEVVRAKELEEHRQMVIEEERRRLLKQHAAHLKDFLPKGTLECAADYDIIFSARAARSSPLGGGLGAAPLTAR